MATFTQLGSGNWRVQVRRKGRYVAETFRRRKEPWFSTRGRPGMARIGSASV